MSSFWGAVLGGLLGGTIPGWVSYRALHHVQSERRQARQWEDAAVLADVYRLLVDIDPARRAANARPEAGVEDERWAEIGGRVEDARAELVKLSAGHPSAEVQAAAERLGPGLSRAAADSRNLVSDLLRARNTPEQLQEAQESHEAALTAVRDLERAVKDAGRGTRPRRRLGRPVAKAIGRSAGQP